MNPRRVINECRSIEDYKLEILLLEDRLKKAQAMYHSGPRELKDPMNWERITIRRRDGTYEDARYCAPKNKTAPGDSNLHLLEYEEELEEKLTLNRLALKQAQRFKEILTSGEEADFMRDYINGRSMTRLRLDYCYANPHTHALWLTKKKLNL